MKSLRILVIPAILLMAGCAQLRVNKITADERACGEDHKVKGFRYYLSRPYVLVKDDILVKQDETLLVVDLSDMEIRPDVLQQLMGCADGQVQLLDVVQSKGAQRVDGSTGELTPVKHEEMVAMRQMIAAAANQRAAQQSSEQATETIVQTGSQTVNTTPSTFMASGSTTAATSTSGEVTAPDITEREAVAPPLGGKMEIVFLPDLDEQYAIQHKNKLARSDIKLRFKDGWELTDVSADIDNTTVAIELLNTIDGAIDSAKRVALASIDRQARVLEAATPPSPGRALAGEGLSGLLSIKLVERSYIRPGLYRVQKPWEMGGQDLNGCGLLSRMGLPTETVVYLEPMEKPKKQVQQ